MKKHPLYNKPSIQIDLSDKVIESIEANALRAGRLRKNYIEYLCIRDASLLEENDMEFDLKEISIWFGGWQNLKDVVDRLCYEDEIAASERAVSRY